MAYWILGRRNEVLVSVDFFLFFFNKTSHSVTCGPVFIVITVFPSQLFILKNFKAAETLNKDTKNIHIPFTQILLLLMCCHIHFFSFLASLIETHRLFHCLLNHWQVICRLRSTAPPKHFSMYPGFHQKPHIMLGCQVTLLFFNP